MKISFALVPLNRTAGLALFCAATLLALARIAGAGPAASAEPEAPGPENREVTVEPTLEHSDRKTVPWLGVSTAEASEALAAQLNLQGGVGLIVTYVTPNSPAAKGGLKKNDVLVQFGGQNLVHPSQLRKLVQVQKAGETVKLGYYRAGKLESITLTLGETATSSGLWEDEGRALDGNLKELHRQLQDLHVDETVRQQMRVLRDSLGSLKIDQQDLQNNIRRGMEQASKAIREAMRNVTNSDPMRKVLENLARSGVSLDDKANVVVRSSGKNTKSLVKSDEDGTVVLISNPRLYLTAHDKEGKLLFDGPIETDEERAKVPQELRDRVDPLVEQMRSGADPLESKATP